MRVVQNKPSRIALIAPADKSMDGLNGQIGTVIVPSRRFGEKCGSPPVPYTQFLMPFS